MTKKTLNNVLKLVKPIGLGLLIFIAVASVCLDWFALTYPQEVITRLQPLVPAIIPVPIKMKGIAVIGDSQSDEYRADDNRGDNYPSDTRNWVELLSQQRNVNFGKWGDWGESRRTGYEYNWSRTGATTNSMLESGQHIGVADQIRQGKVNVVIIFIGANDFAPYITPNGYDAIYYSKLSEPEKKSKINRIIADIKTAIYTFKDAGDVRILLIKIPDWGNHPGVQVAYPFPDQRSQVSEVINQTNTEIDKVAAEENLAALDPNDFYNNLPKNTDGKVVVDGVALERLLLNNNPLNFYLNDGVHTGTVVNGFLANAIIEKLNPMLSNPIHALSEHEIRTAAGL